MLTQTQYTETIEKCGGYYNFISCINRRLKELRNGADPMVHPEGTTDLIDLVVREIEADTINFLPGSGNNDDGQEISL